MRPHLHTDLPHLLFFAFGTIVVIHALRIAATHLADNESTAPAGKVLGAFALAD